MPPGTLDRVTLFVVAMMAVCVLMARWQSCRYQELNLHGLAHALTSPKPCG